MYKRKGNPFVVGDTVRYNLKLADHYNDSYTINRIDDDGWCMGTIKGGGWHYSRLELVNPKRIEVGDVITTHAGFSYTVQKIEDACVYHEGGHNYFWQILGVATNEERQRYFGERKKEMEKIKDQPIIGYKLVKLEYSTAALSIMQTIWGWPEYFVSVDSCIQNLKKAGVLDIWFEPVYEVPLKFKVGDWVIGWHSDSPKYKKNAVWKIKEIVLRNDIYYASPETGYLTGMDDIRLATPAEIEDAKTIKIHGNTLEFLPNNQIKVGCQLFEKKHIDAIKLLLESEYLVVGSKGNKYDSEFSLLDMQLIERIESKLK